MKLKLVINKKDEANRMIVVSAIGLLVSLENHLMTLEDCKKYMFNPSSISILEKEGINEKVIEIIELGCALEKTKSLTEISELKSKAKECLENLPYTLDLNKDRKWLYRF